MSATPACFFSVLLDRCWTCRFAVSDLISFPRLLVQKYTVCISIRGDGLRNRSLEGLPLEVSLPTNFSTSIPWLDPKQSTCQMRKKGNFTEEYRGTMTGKMYFFSTPGLGQYEILAKICRGGTCRQAVQDAGAGAPRRRPVLSIVHPLCAAA
jgi:hypothetical protein